MIYFMYVRVCIYTYVSWLTKIYMRVQLPSKQIKDQITFTGIIGIC